jgi:hypothetical protein
MRRRSFRRLKCASPARFHHHVYVVLLDGRAAKELALRRANPNRNPAKPCVYVGMSGLPPEERFARHKEGIQAAKWVQLYGVRLLPEMYAHFNPMPFEAAVEMERGLAEDLRAQGFTVAGGH